MQNAQSLRQQRGLTLIELMVVVTVLGILMMFAIPSYSGWLERTRVRSAAQALHEGIQLARTEALSRNASVRFSLAPTGAWHISCDSVSGSSGCADTGALHSRPAGEGRGFYMLKVNDTDVAGCGCNKTVVFLPHGSPDTTAAGYISKLDVIALSSADDTSSSRAMQINLSPFGRTRMCYPYGATGAATTC